MAWYFSICPWAVPGVWSFKRVILVMLRVIDFDVEWIVGRRIVQKGQLWMKSVFRFHFLGILLFRWDKVEPLPNQGVRYCSMRIF